MSEPAEPVSVLAAADRLAMVVEQENAALAAGGRSQVRPLLAEKAAACRDYVDAVRAIGERTIRLDAPERCALRIAVERLARAATENNRRLGAAIAAHERLFVLLAAAIATLLPAWALTSAPEPRRARWRRTRRPCASTGRCEPVTKDHRAPVI